MNKEPLKKYTVSGPNFTCTITSYFAYEEFIKSCLDDIKNGQLILKPESGLTVVFTPGNNSPYHLVFMTEDAFNKVRREQMFAAQQQQNGKLTLV